MKVAMLKLLVLIGLTRMKRNGKWFVPFAVPPRWMFEEHGWHKPWKFFVIAAYMSGKWPYMFRNKRCDPWFHRRRYKRLLPFRWGIGWLGFEFGDRGGEHVQ